jgi:hypothetical protein
MNSKPDRFSNSVRTHSAAFWRISENSTGFVNPGQDPGVASTNGKRHRIHAFPAGGTTSYFPRQMVGLGSPYHGLTNFIQRWVIFFQKKICILHVSSYVFYL